jgi:hypothetical protein
MRSRGAIWGSERQRNESVHSRTRVRKPGGPKIKLRATDAYNRCAPAWPRVSRSSSPRPCWRPRLRWRRRSAAARSPPATSGCSRNRSSRFPRRVRIPWRAASSKRASTATGGATSRSWAARGSRSRTRAISWTASIAAGRSPSEGASGAASPSGCAHPSSGAGRVPWTGSSTSGIARSTCPTAAARSFRTIAFACPRMTCAVARCRGKATWARVSATSSSRPTRSFSAGTTPAAGGRRWCCA